MLTSNNYQDIQIIQDSDFLNEIGFDELYDTDDYTYQARIAKDRKGTSFSWGAATATYVSFAIEKFDTVTLKLTLTGATTAKFADDFEGVWDLLSKNTGTSEYVREMEGDVVVSPSVTPKF